MFLLREWIETNEKEKNIEWCQRIVSFIRMYMSPLVSLASAERGMDYLLGRQDMTAIKNLFQNPAALNLNNDNPGANYANRLVGPDGRPINGKDKNILPEMTSLEWISLPVMEKTRNMLVAEMKKMGVILEAKSDDPTATIKRQKDEALIKDKDAIEGWLNYIYTSIGEAPFKMPEHTARFGEKADNGNTEDFQRMNLDNTNPSDVDFFMKHFHKLDCEIAAENPINYVMRFNEVEDIFFENWATDMIAKKAIAAQQYVSKLNGAIKYDYLTPETVYIYGGGRRKDYDDANAKAYQQTITIKDLLDRIGDSFDFERELNVLFQAVYTCSQGAIDITGIGPDNRNGAVGASWYATSRGGTRYSYREFMNFKVTFGYMEWISANDNDYQSDIEGVGSKKFEESRDTYANDAPGATENPEERYAKKARYEVPTYKAYYLVLSAYQQRIFDFGKVSYQQITGYNDYNANWTILTYKEIGESIAVNCATFVDLMNECWYKFKFEIRKAKARGMDYNYDSILAIAEDTYADTNLSKADKIQKIVSWYDGSANILTKFPEVDGKIVPIPSNQLNVERPNGLTPEIMKWWEILISTWDKMLSFVGLDAPLRQGDPGGTRDSMNNQFKALEYSQNNTYYLPDSITFMTQKLATRTMLQVQDIIQFKDHDTLAYKFLVDAVGEDTLASISALGKKAMHRYGIFVESLNQAPQKVKLQARIDLAIQNGKISNAEALLVEEIRSPKKAFLVLAYFEQRNTAVAQKNAMQLQQQQAKQQQAMLASQEKQIVLKGNFDLENTRLENAGNLESHMITQKGQLTKQEMKENADSRLIAEQAKANISEEQASLNNTGKTTPPAPQYQTPQPTQGTLPQPRQQSAIQQQIQTTQPQSTEAAMPA